MKRLNDKYKLCETIEDLNVCKFLELQVYNRIEKDAELMFSCLVVDKSESPDLTDETYLNELTSFFVKKDYFGHHPISYVKDFLKNTQKTLRLLFPKDFQGDNFLINQVRQYLIMLLDIHSIDNWANEVLNNKLEEVKQIIDNETQDHQLPDIKEMYSTFENLCFWISQVDGNITVPDLKKLSVYDFYTYKRNCQDKVKAQKKSLKNG